MGLKKLNEDLRKLLNEIVMERYIKVSKGNLEYNKDFSWNISLMEGDRYVQDFGLDHADEYTDEEIIEYAKMHFDNITDDIKVVREE